MNTGEIDEDMDDAFEAYDFCKHMHESTKLMHDESDKIVSSRLAVVLTDKRSYGSVLTDFYYVYKHIEDLYDRHSKDTLLNGLLPDFFRRTRAIERDLQFYLGDKWAELAMPSTAAVEYIGHLNDVVSENPVILIAYIHSMYLALLAGGVVINNLIRRTLGLKDKRGLCTFEFKFPVYPQVLCGAGGDVGGGEVGGGSGSGHILMDANGDAKPRHSTGAEQLDLSGDGGGGRSRAKREFKAAINLVAMAIPSEVRERILQEKRQSFALNNRVANHGALSDWTAYSRLAGIACTGVGVFGFAAFLVAYTTVKVMKYRSS